MIQQEGTTYRAICEDLLSVCDKRMICYYYHISMFDTSKNKNEWLIV